MIYVSLYTPSVRMCQWVLRIFYHVFPKATANETRGSGSLDFFYTIFDFPSLHLLIENLE